MQKWYHPQFMKSSGIHPLIWLIFGILPFYFILQSSSPYKIAGGIVMIVAFFFSYWLTLGSRGWPVYVGTSVQIAVSIAMTLLFGYVYFAFFLAFFIGNVQHRAGFFTLYTVHLATTFIAINIALASQDKFFLTQLPFILISLMAVILLPINSYNSNKRGQLQEQLNDANKRIADLVKLEERQRIARDLHDTLGQKLSLIGLKSDLASKLILKRPQQAHAEIKDVQQTARGALKELRQIVTHMRGARLTEEIHRMRQILQAAGIVLDHSAHEAERYPISPMAENVLGMCLKEAATNVVKHSSATRCELTLEATATEFVMKLSDDGVGIPLGKQEMQQGFGLQGMKERLEFVNGSLDIVVDGGTTVIAKVPLTLREAKEERK